LNGARLNQEERNDCSKETFLWDVHKITSLRSADLTYSLHRSVFDKGMPACPLASAPPNVCYF
jgi:hypothetical protein